MWGKVKLQGLFDQNLLYNVKVLVTTIHIWNIKFLSLLVEKKEYVIAFQKYAEVQIHDVET